MVCFFFRDIKICIYKYNYLVNKFYLFMKKLFEVGDWEFCYILNELN